MTRGANHLSRRDVLKGAAAVAAAAIVAPAAAACAPAAAPAPAATAAPVKGGHITEGSVTGATDLSPIRSSFNLLTTTMYVGLLALLPDGSLTPRLAQALPKLSADGLTYTFDLRKDAKWTDGAAVTAADVVFTYKLMYHPDYKAVTSPFRADLEASVADVRAPDPNTVVIQLKTPRAAFITTHSQYGLLPEHILGTVPAAAINSHEFNTAPKVTNGPFKLLEWINDDHITVARNDTYYGGAPYLDRYIIKFADQSSILEQLKTGEIDLFRANVFSRFDELANQPNLDFNVIPTGNGPRIYFNLDPAAPVSKIFQSKAVRQALRYAADIQGYNNAVLFKVGAIPSSTGVFQPASWANNPNGKPAYTLDKAKAEQLLDADGWKRGASGVRAKDGLALKFELLTSADSQEWQQGAAILQQNWKDIGADVSIRAPRNAQQIQNALDREFEVIMQTPPYATNVDPDPSQGFHSRGAVKGARNFSNYKNAQVDQLLDQAATTLDQAKRKDLYFQLQDIINEDIPSFNTPFTSQGWTHNKRIKGVGPEVYSGFLNATRWFLERAYVTDGK